MLQQAAGVLRPLDKRNRAIEVRLEVAPGLETCPAQTVEVEMRDRNRRGVQVTDRVGRARDGDLDAERPARAPDERRLPAPELAGDRDDRSDLEPGREPRPERRRLLVGRGDQALLASGLRQKSPS